MTIPCHFIIQNLRREHGYHQRDIAAYLCVSVRSYSDYETGVTRISLSQLISLAKLYDVDMNYISGISEERRSYPLSSADNIVANVFTAADSPHLHA